VVLRRRELGAILLAAAALAFYMILLAAAPSEARRDLDCSDFRSQKDAQAVLDRNPRDPNNLDPDNDGVACERLPRRGGGKVKANQSEGNRSRANQSEGNRSRANQLEGSRSRVRQLQNDLNENQTVSQLQDDEVTGLDEGTDLDAFEEDLDDQLNTSSANQNRPQGGRTVVNVPRKPLPPSGGLPVYGTVAGFVLTGAGLLALGLLIRRGSRER
jgi:hypothetical protein